MSRTTTDIINDLLAFYGYTKYAELAVKLGVSASRIANWKNRDTKIWDVVMEQCPEVDINKLKAGTLLESGKTYDAKAPQKEIAGDPTLGYFAAGSDNCQHMFYEITRLHPALCITDAESRITQINDSFTRQTGYKLSEIQGKTLSEVLQRRDFDINESARIRRKLQAGEPFYTTIAPNYTKGGVKIECNIYIHPILNQGEVTGYISFANFTEIN